jgi:hypothetical protein
VDDQLKGLRLAAIAALAFVLFNAPILSIADSDARVLGIPVLFVYLFAAWAVVITLIALVVRGSR